MTDHTSFSRRLRPYEIAAAQEVVAYLVTVKYPGGRREFATLPGYMLLPDETLTNEVPLIAAAQADSQCGLGVGMPTPAPASAATHITDEAGNFVLAPTSRTPTVTPAPTTDEHDITEARIATWRDRVNRLERALAVYQRASAELPEEPKGWGCQVAEYESEWVVAIEDYRALRAAAVALKVENSTLKVEYEQMNDAAILLQERAEKAEAALAEARKAGFKLTAALCALPEDDKEKISRPRVMELVVAWRDAIDAAKIGAK